MHESSARCHTASPSRRPAPSPLAGEGGGEGLRRPPATSHRGRILLPLPSRERAGVRGSGPRRPTSLRGQARVSCGGLRPPHPHPGRARCAALAHPPALGILVCGGYAPTPPSGSAGGAQPRGRTRTPFRHSGESFRHSGESRNPSGASEGLRRPPANKPSRAGARLLRGARLWPTHPPSEFLLCGGCAPTPPSGPAGGAHSPEGARAPLSVIPAKAGIHPGHRRGSHARRPTSLRGRTRVPLRGAAPPTPPSRTSALRGSWPTHPPSEFLLCGGCAPTPPPGAPGAAPAADRALNACAGLPVNRRAHSPEGARAPLSVIPAKAGIHPGHRRGSGPRRPTSLRGQARVSCGGPCGVSPRPVTPPPTPPSRTSALRGSWPTHPPSEFLLCGGCAPTPPSGPAGGAQSRGRSGPLAPCGREGGGEGFRALRAFATVKRPGGCRGASGVGLPLVRRRGLVIRRRGVRFPAGPPPVCAGGRRSATPPSQPPKAAPAPSPLAGEGGGEGLRRPPADKPPRARACPLRGALRGIPASGDTGPTPPSRTSALRGSGPPTHPRISFHVGASPPRPRPELSRATHPIEPGSSGGRAPSPQPSPPGEGAGFEGVPAPSPLAGEGGGEGVRRPPDDKPSRPLPRIRGKRLRATARSPPSTPLHTTPQPQPALSGSSRGGVGGNPPLRQQHNPPPGNAPPRIPKWIVEGGCGGEPPLKKLDACPRVRYKRTWRGTARGPPPLTRGPPRALLPMCRASPSGRCASHTGAGAGAGGKQASSGTGRRDGVCGVQLERRRKRVCQAPARNGSPVQGGLSGRTTRNATTQRVPP